MAAKSRKALDRIDIRILAALQRDGRVTIQKLAETVGLSPRPCLERVRRLEGSGIILGYRTLIDIDRLSRPVTIFAEIALGNHAHRSLVARRLAAIDEIVECFEVTGTVDYLARFVCADLVRYEELNAQLVDDPKLGVARIVSHVVLRRIRRFTGYPDSLLVPKSE
jgi:DNA-binding Lrp family transcriptional regulator